MSDHRSSYLENLDSPICRPDMQHNQTAVNQTAHLLLAGMCVDKTKHYPVLSQIYCK